MSGEELVVRDPEPMLPVHADGRGGPVNLFGGGDPESVIRGASKAATALADVIRKQRLYSEIPDKYGNIRDHVRVEGWTLLGSMLGVFPVCVWSREIQDGWEARVEARTLAGALVGAAEATCSRSEKSWRDRDAYAIRSMAQTRATSKALRLPLGFVVALAGFDATPAEEMDGIGHQENRPAAAKPTRPPAKPRQAGRPAPPKPAPQQAAPSPTKQQKPAAAPITYPPEDGDVTGPEAEEGYMTLRCLKISERSGTSDRGKPWTRWGVQLGDDLTNTTYWGNTFDKTIADRARTKVGSKIKAKLETNSKGFVDILDILPDEPVIVPDVPDESNEDLGAF